MIKSMTRSGSLSLWRLVRQCHEWQLGRNLDLIRRCEEGCKAKISMFSRTFVSVSGPRYTDRDLSKSTTVFPFGNKPVLPHYFQSSLIYSNFVWSQLRAMSSRKGGAVKRLARAAQRVSKPLSQTPHESTAPKVVKPQEVLPSFAQVASVVDHSALIVARPIEWCVVCVCV